MSNAFSAGAVAGVTAGVTGPAKSINVEQMQICLDELANQITNIKTATESYDTSVPSIEGSSFAGTITGLLNGIKSSYGSMQDELDKIQAKIDEVKATYAEAAQAIEKMGN